jgi:predicted lysophospholipase L1 biosynthesis ABC-type transport system permease subunit
VSRTLAGELWPGEDPIGKQLRVGGPTAPWRAVVGVVGDVRHMALGHQGTGQFYVPEREWPWSDGGATLVVRTIGSPETMAHTLRQVAASVDPTQPISRIETMEHIAVDSIAQQRVATLLFTAFATIALILAGGGIYGALAGSVAERTREIGLRNALGAAPASILGMIIAQGARLAVIGAALGCIGAFIMTRFLRALLYQITPMDPATIVSVGAVLAPLAMVALCACLIPAFRAVRIDPISALRDT